MGAPSRVEGARRTTHTWIRAISAISASSPISITANPRWPIGCWNSPARSPSATWPSRCSTRWTWSARRASPSRRRPCACATPRDDGQEYELNLIDTPGHVDFTYEVSRSLAACEGAILVVDATQGIEAQTLANVYLALEHDLDHHPGDQQDRPAQRRARAGARGDRGRHRPRPATRSCWPPPKRASAPTRSWRRWCSVSRRRVATATQPLRALIFDSKYDAYKGVIAYVRVVDGTLARGDRMQMMQTDSRAEVLEVGYLQPDARRHRQRSRRARSATSPPGFKNVERLPGRRHDHAGRPPSRREALPGYRPAKPMVFAGLYPGRGRRLPAAARRAGTAAAQRRLARLRAGDLGGAGLRLPLRLPGPAAHGDHPGAAGARVQSRICWPPRRAWSTWSRAPTARSMTVDNPAELPAPTEIAKIEEPWMDISIFTPARYIGAIMELVTDAARRVQQHGVHRRGPRAPDLSHAAAAS